MPREHRYPVHWIEVDIPDGKKSSLVAICSKTREVIRPPLHALEPYLINNLIAKDNDCEEATACLNTACPLNRTTVVTLSRAMGRTHPPKWLTQIRIQPVKMADNVRIAIDKLCDEHPDHGMLQWQIKKRA